MSTKNSVKTYELVDNIDALTTKLAQIREAQQIFATYTQEQVDKIFFAAAMAANKARIPLAKMAVEETGMGIVEDKVIKNHYASEYIYNAYKDTKTCGRTRRRRGVRNQKGCGADWCNRSGYPDDEPDLDRNI